MAIIRGYPLISYENIKKIIQQMERCICHINVNNSIGTGFFCKIPFPDTSNMLPVLITTNHIFNGGLIYQKDSKINLAVKNSQNHIQLELNNRMKYTNEEYDITIIEIRENEGNIINSFLELDNYVINSILEEDKEIDLINNLKYNETPLYIPQYAENHLVVSYGVTNAKKDEKEIEYEFLHRCSTSNGSTGAPILNVHNNKIIGLHVAALRRKNEYLNLGIFLNYPIKEFIKLNYKIDYEKLLKEFNKKYNLNIRDTKIEKLDLRWKDLGNTGLEDLCKIEFKELKEIILNNNNISDLKILSQAKFDKLEILDLSQNKISDINIFKNVNFKELKQLYLCYNNISDIKVFEKANFEKLEMLFLNNNKIDKIKNASIISNLKSKVGTLQV